MTSYRPRLVKFQLVALKQCEHVIPIYKWNFFRFFFLFFNMGSMGAMPDISRYDKTVHVLRTVSSQKLKRSRNITNSLSHPFRKRILRMSVCVTCDCSDTYMVCICGKLWHICTYKRTHRNGEIYRYAYPSFDAVGRQQSVYSIGRSQVRDLSELLSEAT